MAINPAGAIGDVMQPMVQQQRPQGIDRTQDTARNNQVEPLYGRGGRDPPQPVTSSWPKLKVDPQQEMAQLRQRLEQWVQSIVDGWAREVNITKDQPTGELVTSVVNPKTGELVRQVPSAIDLHVQFWMQRFYELHSAEGQGGSFNALA